MRLRAGFDALDGARRQPFLIGSLALHAAMLAGLYFSGPHSLRQQQQAHDASRIAAVLDAARRAQMQRHLQRLEALARELKLAPPTAADVEPLQRAQALAERIEQAEQVARAARLSRLLGIKPAEALQQIRAEDARRRRTLPPPDPAHALAHLEQRARGAAQRMRDQARQEAAGHRLASASAGKRTGAQQGGAASHLAAEGRAHARAGGRPGGGSGGGEPTASIGGVGEPQRIYDGATRSPSLDTAQLRLATGRSFGPGAHYANRVFLDRWSVVGPFAAQGSRALGDVLGPELAVDLDAIYQGKHGLVSWTAQHSATYPFVPEPREADAVYYASTELRMDRDTEAWLDVGVDDDAKLWLNDELVWESGNGDKPWYRRPYDRLDEALARYGLVEQRIPVTLRAGRNTLLLKLYNGVDLMFFSVVVAR